MIDTTIPVAARAVGAGEGTTVAVLGDRVTIKALADETGGAYSLFETETAPGAGTPPHLQRHEEESFYVLAGTYAFRLGDETRELGPGGYAFVPRGTVHAFTNTGEAPARMLILVTPGGIHERFFLEMGELAADPTAEPDIARIVSIATAYGIEILPPDA
jgi:quercetin dioxygenase-like cupin family protein